MERGWREISPNCPRCGSTNTKFCYYNNYSLTQPRYFCKGCRRYWTKGGSLRNVPVGGGCRKSRRSRPSSLRLATSNNHHLNVGNSNIMFGLGGHIGATSITNNQLGHNSYDTTNIMVESNNSPSSTNSEAPTIDLAVVYANFLNKKPENNIVNSIELPQIHNEFEDSSIELPTKLNVSSHGNPSLPGMQHHHHHHQQQQQHEPIMIGCAKDTPFSQGLTTLPYLGNDNKDHDNQRFLEEFSTPTHHTHQEEITSIDQQELGFPPLPGESSPWTPISSHDNHIANIQAPLRLPGLDPDPHQFSNLYIGNWSPLDFPGFETSSSSSMP